MTEDALQPEVTTPESGFLYRTVTRYWPRIAAGLVVIVGIIEWVVGGLTSNGALEFYAFAWATATASLWFMFEKAERVLSEESREKVVGWMAQSDFKGTFSSIPDQFASLFDRVFGERHLTWSCFWRSSVASIFAVWIVTLLWAIPHPPSSLATGLLLFAGITAFAVIFNLIPDYLSLLETRFVLAGLQRSRRVAGLLLADLCATAALGFLGSLLVRLLAGFGPTQTLDYVWETVTLQFLVHVGGTGADSYVMPLGIFFYSTFLTSVWLWLYSASVLVSRILVRLGGGVGFLLKITDVEKQPFRSMGFTSVVIVSLLFLVGLPFVLLA
jgi:hypothetical protein